MNAELALTIDELQQYADDRIWFIPVLLSECDVPAKSSGAGETLLDINWVPLYEDWNAGLQRILSVIKPVNPKIQNLILTLQSDISDIRKRAVSALGEIVDPAAVSAIEKALADEDSDLGNAARSYLKKLASKNS